MNKTFTKRLLSLVLLVVMLVGCALPAYAVDTGADGDLTAEYALRGATYKDGVYEGTGKGYWDGEIKVQVTIADGKIANVELVSQDKQSYWDSKDVASLFDKIVEANGTEIDGISGATKSSNGVKAAVNDALSKALVTEPEQPEAGVFAAGTGAKSDPYLIRTVDQLNAFAASVNSGETYESQYITLDADLDLSGESWTPIGGASGSFCGFFSGDNHVITGLTIGSKAEPSALEDAGLFGMLGRGGAIRNLGVKDASIDTKPADVEPAVGILVACMADSSVVDGCWATGTVNVNASGTSRYAYIGGLVGTSGIQSLVCNSWADVQIAVGTGCTEAGAGGIVGWTGNNSAVINCAAFGSIENNCNAQMMYGAGGIVGYSSGAIYACYSDMTLHADAQSYENGADVSIGGIAGGTSYMAAGYQCWFNEEAGQTYYGGDAVAEQVANGYSGINYLPSENEKCEGLTAAQFADGTLSAKLAAALTEEALADAQAYFSGKDIALLKTITMDTFMSMSENGWNGWQTEGGRLLPTGESAIAPVDPSDYFAGGEGTQADPYRIATAVQLSGFAAATQAGKLVTRNLYFQLDADIALTDAWTPIHNFAGTFDGNGHTVSGVTMGTEAAPLDQSSVGFFDSLAKGATVKNLMLTDVAVYVSSSAVARLYVGGLVGGADAGANTVIDNCSVTGSIVSAASSSNVLVGGLAGMLGNDSRVTNSYADIAVSGSSTKYAVAAGGLVGSFGSSSFVGNCAALGDVAVSGNSLQYNRSRAGGLIASAPYLTENCYAAGNVTMTNASSEYDAYAGMLIGEQSGSAVVDSHYSSKAVCTVNGERKDPVAVGKTPDSWYNGINYNKITAQEDVTNDAFAAVMNQGVSAEGLAAADEYLISSGKFSGYTAEGLAAMRPAAWQSWGAVDGKVLIGVETPRVFASGTGTQADPFLIETEAQLRAFAATTIGDNAVDYAGQFVALDADITLAGAWTPIHSFAGSFDGRNHTVSNVTVGTAAAPYTLGSAGFFDVLADNAQISNLHLRNVNVYSNAEDSQSYPVVAFAGGLVGGANRTGNDIRIDHCSVIGGCIAANCASGQAQAGGVIGYAYQGWSVTNCLTDVAVSAKSSVTFAIAGGLVGCSLVSLYANCAALGDVTADGDNMIANLSGKAGGFAGQAAGVFQNCYTAGNVTLVNTVKANTPAVGAFAGELSMGYAVRCSYNQSAALQENGAALTTAAFGVCNANNSATNQIVGADTGAAIFADTMNEGLNKASLASDKQWLIDEAGRAASWLEARYPTVWYGWTADNAKTVLSDKPYVEQEGPDAIFASGKGTQEDPWIIQTVAQLRAFHDSFLTTGYSGKYIALGADLDLSGEAWTPIGHTEKGMRLFAGNFNGCGHKITGMTIGTEAAPVLDTAQWMYYGFFAGLTNYARVENLGLENASLYVTGKESVFAGIISGYSNQSTVNHCWATGTVVVKTQEGQYQNNCFSGGLVGYSQASEILNSWVNVHVDAYCNTANAEAGGIAGMNAFGIIANCYALGVISGETNRNVDDGGVIYLGGIAGCQAGTIANCYSLCDLTARSWTKNVGAIGGMATAISESFDSYYNDSAKLTIAELAIDPVVPFGTLVAAGYNEDGDYMSGSLVSGVAALPAADMTAQALVDRLNGNFAEFPVSGDDISAPLKQWALKDGVVTFGDTDAQITYVPVERPDAPVSYDYKDGVYYGRDKNKTVVVRITVEDQKIVSAEIVSPADFDAANAAAILEALINDQTVKDTASGTDDDQTLKSALSVAASKALVGDTSGYDAADPSSIFDGGTGTKEDPYRIETADQLRAFAAAVNEDEHFEGEYIVLTADIILTGTQWMPVGSGGAHYFAGIFDGQNHRIYGMTIGSSDAPTDYASVGLFAYVDGGIIQNLGVVDASIYNRRSDNYRTYAGIIAGVVDKTETGCGSIINNCTVSGTIYNQAQDWSQIGGIAGYCFDSIIINCGAAVDLTVVSTNSSAFAGGIVGIDGFAIVANSYAIGSIYADANVNAATIGGIAGMQAGTAGNNYADMKLVSKNHTGDIGGIAGRNTAIGTILYGYYNKEQEMRSGNTVITEEKPVGVNVTMLGNTGVVEETAVMTGAELRSEAFRDLLNDNQCDQKQLQSALNDAITGFKLLVRSNDSLVIDTWILDGIVRQEEAPAMTAPESVAAPVVDPNGGSFTDAQTVTITCATEGASIYYTTDGSDPTTESTLYTGAFELTESATVKAIAVKNGCLNSEIVTVTFEKSKPAIVFDDVAEDAWYYDAVQWAVGAGVTVGTGNGHFSPNMICTRAQAVMFLWNAAGNPTPKTTDNPFVDVSEDAYYYQAMLWAVGEGITEGTGNNCFSPDMIATRSQIVSFLYRYAGSPAVENAASFTDVPATAYYADAVAWAMVKGVTEGTGNNCFSPLRDCTRAEMVCFLYNYFAK